MSMSTKYNMDDYIMNIKHHFIISKSQVNYNLNQ